MSDQHVRHLGGGMLALFNGDQQVRVIGSTDGWDFRDRDAFIDAYNSRQDKARIEWLQEQAELGCVSMCFELDGGFHVTLDPAERSSVSARAVEHVRDGIDVLMQGRGMSEGSAPDEAKPCP